jgi:hypothetical protein|tara:strand:+ start:4432 stop:4725 length:294 start_codon:yes stop_codon:yes gene_type:complete
MDASQRSKLKELVRTIIQKDLEEITTTGDVDGYSTPRAFAKNKKKRNKDLSVALKATGYSLAEELDSKDEQSIKKMIRKEVAAILRDIWIKRGVWTS